MTQFFKLTPAAAETVWSADLTKSEWKLWAYLVALDPFGDRQHNLWPIVTAKATRNS